MNYKICRIETLEELIKEHKNISRKILAYEFDEISYTLLLIEINKVLQENQQLKDIINKARDYVDSYIIERSNSMGDFWCDMEGYRKQELLEILDNKRVD